MATAAWHCDTAAGQEEQSSGKEEVNILCALLKVCIGICPCTSKFEVNNRKIMHKSGDHITK